MNRIHLQFHAEPDELLEELLPKWLPGIDYFYVLRNRDGVIVDRRGHWGPLVTSRGVGDISEVIIRLCPFESNGGSSIEFLRRNPDFLSVSVAHVRDGGLREAAIGSMAVEEKSLAVWRRVVRRARSELLKGAVQVGAQGARVVVPQHRYSRGAVELSTHGVRMLAIAGIVAYELDSDR